MVDKTFWGKEQAHSTLKQMALRHVADTLLQTYSPVRAYYFTKSVQVRSTTKFTNPGRKKETGICVIILYFFSESSGPIGFFEGAGNKTTLLLT